MKLRRLGGGFVANMRNAVLDEVGLGAGAGREEETFGSGRKRKHEEQGNVGNHCYVENAVENAVGRLVMKSCG